MNLEFLPQLTEEEMIELINFCMIQRDSKREVKTSPRELIDHIKIFGEQDRRDLNGNQYFYVQTAHGILVLSCYKISDFHMTTDDYGFYTKYPSVCYDEALRIFMTKRFGESYIKALYQKQVKAANKEVETLSQYLPQRTYQKVEKRES